MDTEQPFTVRLWRTFTDSSVLTNMDFELNRVLGKFPVKRYRDDDSNADFIKFYGLVEAIVNPFIPTTVSTQFNCKQACVDNKF